MMDSKGRTTRRELIRLGASALGTGLIHSAAHAASKDEANGLEVDLCVYGATAGGVAAAVQAQKLGKRVVLVEPGKHVGGMTSGGLGATDVGNLGAIGGFARDFYRRVYDYYLNKYGPGSPQLKDCKEGFHFEPHVAEELLTGMISEAGASLYLGCRLKEVRKVNNRLVELVTENDKVFRARYFVDATYEGDLMAAAKVSYSIGRESNAQYNETLNGFQIAARHNFRFPVDPYVKEGDPTSGLLKGIRAVKEPKAGEGDKHIQAYCYRMCLTDVVSNQVPFPRLEDYNPERYTLLARYLKTGVREFYHLSARLPNGKTDMNNFGAISTDYIGAADAYPEGDWKTREKIIQDHITYQQGLMYFLCHDEQVPWPIRFEVCRWGLPKDEFLDSAGWPHQLYVRESRRLQGMYVMTEHNCRGALTAEDPICLASYPMDSHNCQRLVMDGRVVNEGNVEAGGFKPYPVSYRAILPVEAECANLLVPVCLSASHIAYGSLRMEPVFMCLGQAAGVAISMAADAGVPVQRIDTDQLRDRLLSLGGILYWNRTAPPAATVVAKQVPPIDPRSLPGIVLDDKECQKSGPWFEANAPTVRRVGTGYIHDGNTNKGLLTAAYTPDLPNEGSYNVVLLFPSEVNRATNTPVTISVDGVGSTEVQVNQRAPERPGMVSLGSFKLPKGKLTTVTIQNRDTDGYVVADAVQFLPV